MRFLLNIYPPYLGAGVRVSYIRSDWRELHVSMALKWFNRNYVGTHFGGSLYSMVDPHLMLLLIQILGSEYRVWDKAADIDFIKAATSRVTAKIVISDDDLDLIREKTAGREKYFALFVVEIRDSENDLVAKVRKTIYLRRKPKRT